MKKIILTVGLCLVLVLSMGIMASAEDLTFSYTDPEGDATGPIDIISMVVVFDNATGHYTITLTSTLAQPFLGEFRININLFNPARLPYNSFFQDAGNDFNLETPVTKIVLEGYDADLLFWAVGDTVATNTIASGGLNPPGSSWYRCQVITPPFVMPFQEDNIAYDASGIATISYLTPQGAVTGLLDDVQEAMENGFVSPDQASGLSDKLGAVIDSLNRGNMQSARNQIGAFINQIRAFYLTGTLTWEQAQYFIQKALDIRAMIGI